MRRRSSRRIGVGAARTPSNVTVPDVRIVEAQEQVEDRALAGAGRADDRDLLARLDAERHAVEHDRPPAAPDRRSARPRTRPRRAAGCGSAHRMRRRADLRLDRRAARSAARPRPRPATARPRPRSTAQARSRRTPHRARTGRACPASCRPASTSCAPTQRMTTTLPNTRKMMIAVRTARARVDWIAPPEGALDRGGEARLRQPLVGEGLQRAHRADQLGRIGRGVGERVLRGARAAPHQRGRSRPAAARSPGWRRARRPESRGLVTTIMVDGADEQHEVAQRDRHRGADRAT